MTMLKGKIFFISLCLLALNASANWTGKTTLANDYLFNGISQTQKSMPLQAAVNWSANNGIYLSSGASNVNSDQQENFKLNGYNKNIQVQYHDQGELYVIEGKSTADGYRFNENSSKVLTLATLNWPPYISEELCNKGWVFQFTVALLVSKGYQVNIQFYPWARSVKLVEQGKVDILFPEYFIESSAPSDNIPNAKRSELLMLSNQFPGGEIALFKRKGEPFELKKDLSNLKGKFIGVVRGYQNSPEFDAMMDAKLFDVINAVDELQLIKLLAAKRVDFIIGDPKVFTYSIIYSKLSNNTKQALLDGVEQVYPALKYNHLYFAISNKFSQWRQLLDDINLAIIAFHQNGETKRLMDKGSGCTINGLHPSYRQHHIQR